MTENQGPPTLREMKDHFFHIEGNTNWKHEALSEIDSRARASIEMARAHSSRALSRLTDEALDRDEKRRAAEAKARDVLYFLISDPHKCIVCHSDLEKDPEHSKCPDPVCPGKSWYEAEAALAVALSPVPQGQEVPE